MSTMPAVLVVLFALAIAGWVGTVLWAHAASAQREARWRTICESRSDALARCQDTIAELTRTRDDLAERLARGRRTVARLKRELRQRPSPHPASAARDLVDSGLPGVIIQALAAAPVQGPHLQRLQRWAEVEWVAAGQRPEAAEEIARRIAAGDEGPDVDELDLGE